MRKKSRIAVGILGATGTVGQKFVSLLEDHPWFMVAAVAASAQSAGKKYGDVVAWRQSRPIPKSIRQMEIQTCRPGLQCPLVFSALDASVAGEIETLFAQADYVVVSNSKNHRMDQDVPLMIPELNPQHLGLIAIQRRNRNSKGFIVTNSNCSTMFLAMVLCPIHKKLTVESVIVTTNQAVSGAGYPGVPSLDIIGNVIPHIAGEEEKMELETLKILGSFNGLGVDLAGFPVSAQCCRVAVEEGHMAYVSLKLGRKSTVEEITDLLESFCGPPQNLRLPSAPEHPVSVMREPDHPQPRFDIHRSEGMAALVGRIRSCSVLDFKFTILGHNTIRGAAGAAILNAEFLKAKGFLDQAGVGESC